MRIRTDMEKIFSGMNCLLVNVGVFSSVSGEDLGISANLSPHEILSEFRSLDTEIVFYGLGAEDFASTSDFGDMITKNGHSVTDNRAYVRTKANAGGCVVLSSELSDMDIFHQDVFSVTPVSASLDLKAVANYVSNFNGEAVFTELGNLIVSSKSGRRE